MKKGYISALLGCFLLTLPAIAEETSIHPQTSVNPFDTAIMSSPLIAKISYRSQWEADNQPEYSYLFQIEEFINSPTIDPVLQEQLKKQLPIVKRINYGLKDKPVSHFQTLDFKNQSSQILSKQAENTKVSVSIEELKKVMPSSSEIEYLKKEVQKSAQSKAKHSGININDF